MSRHKKLDQLRLQGYDKPISAPVRWLRPGMSPSTSAHDFEAMALFVSSAWGPDPRKHIDDRGETTGSHTHFQEYFEFPTFIRRAFWP